MKELLLLSKIADVEGIKVEDDDLALEIEAMAARTGESVRRIRSRVEKEGGADSLGTQLLERKVIDRILESCEIEDVAGRDRARGAGRDPGHRGHRARGRSRRTRRDEDAEVGKRLKKDREPASRDGAVSTGPVDVRTCPAARDRAAFRARAVGQLGLDSEGPFHAV